MADPPIACTLSDDALRVRKGSLARLVSDATKTTKLGNGFCLEFAAAAETLANIVAIIDAERQCCRFLRFALTVEPNLRTISLEVTGLEGAQEFLEGLLDLA